MSSLPPSNTVAAIVYQDNQFGGQSMTLTPTYSSPDLKNTAIGDNKIKSIKIAPGFSVALFQAKNFDTSKPNITIAGPADIPVLPETPNLYGEVSSLRVISSGSNLSAITGKTMTGTLTQTSQAQQYTRCGHSSCLGGDWRIDKKKCGSFNSEDKAICGLFNSATCPRIGATPVQAGWLNPQANENPLGADVKCTYDIGFFSSPNDITTWLNTPWNNKAEAIQQYDSILMPNYCSVQVSGNSCPIDPATGARMPQCSRFVSTKADGDQCRQWAINSRTPGNVFASGNADAAMIAYCNKYNTPDCLCLNRDQDPLYREFTSTGSGNNVNIIGDAQCWWLNCVGKSSLKNTLVTADLSRPCQTNVCAQFNTISQGQMSAINNNEFEQKIDCDFPTFTQPTTPTPPSPGVPTPTPETPLPKGFANGDIVQCKATKEIYLIENGTRRLFPKGFTPAPVPTKIVNQCGPLNKIPAGDPMPTGTGEPEPTPEPEPEPEPEPIPPGPTPTPPSPTPPEPTPPTPQPQTSRFPTWIWFVIGGVLLLLLILIGAAIFFFTRR
jgi:hypothetical protein